MEKDALSVSGIDLGCDASLGSAGPVVPADEAWVVGWLVPPTWAALQLSNQLIFLLSLPSQTHTHTHIVHTPTSTHTLTQARAYTDTRKPKKINCCVMHIPRHILTHIPISSQMNPNSDFVISNSCSDVNLRSSLFSKNVNTR